MHDHSSSSPTIPSIDALTDMLLGLRVEGVRYGRRHLDGRWAFSFASHPEATFHFAGATPFWLRCGDGDWTPVEAGEAVLLPRGGAHVIASDPGVVLPAPWQPSPEWESGYVPEREGCVLFSGSLRFNLGPRHPLLVLLPDVMRARTARSSETAIAPLLEAMGREIAANRVGACGMVARLADVVAAQVIRAFIEEGSSLETGWLAAVKHPQIGRVLAAIHAAPERDWTVADLAALTGASRSSFAEKFSRLLGMPPARYIAEVRMARAQELLAGDRMRLGEVAARLGYESEPAFSRAFKRVVGVPPSLHRKTAGTVPRNDGRHRRGHASERGDVPKTVR